MRKPLKTFKVYFAAPTGCVTIRAGSMKEAKTIAQDNYDRGELTSKNAELRLLPEGRSIEATFYDPDEERHFIMTVDEEDP